jgi:2-(1,2-epoxy-1,2-dihydrophenyl)acetyl-CoA isomerase
METLLVRDAAGVRTITLNRPEALNAVDDRMSEELQSVLKQTERERTVRCLVLTGAGRAFCAGQDLKSVQEKRAAGGDLDYAADLRRRYNPIILKLRTIEIPVLASINGVAAGAGWSLALACDLRIASRAARFVGAFSKIGLIPDSGMTFTLPRLAGLARALEIAFFGEPLTAEQAQAFGLVNWLVEPAELESRTNQLATTLAKSATRGLGLTKRAMNAGLLNDLESHLQYEADLQGISGRTADHHEGVAAFVEKREPEFKGE